MVSPTVRVYRVAAQIALQGSITQGAVHHQLGVAQDVLAVHLLIPTG
jgi:hypothetical protein